VAVIKVNEDDEEMNRRKTVIEKRRIFVCDAIISAEPDHWQMLRN
jgi:hypothetical protein